MSDINEDLARLLPGVAASQHDGYLGEHSMAAVDLGGQLMLCIRCWSLVPAGARKLHDAWHVRLDDGSDVRRPVGGVGEMGAVVRLRRHRSRHGAAHRDLLATRSSRCSVVSMPRLRAVMPAAQVRQLPTTAALSVPGAGEGAAASSIFDSEFPPWLPPAPSISGTFCVSRSSQAWPKRSEGPHTRP